VPDYFAPIDMHNPDFGDLYDELPLWSAPFGQMLLERVPMKRGQTILDVGCGTGFLSLELAQRCGADSSVIAVDPWPAAMRRLRWKIERLGLTNLRLLEHDAAAIDLPEASVDLVVSNLGVNNFENADAVLRTCFRVLKPGAPLFLTSNLVGHMQEFYDVFRGVLPAERLPALDAHVRHRATVESLGHMLTAAGFEVSIVELASMFMRFADGSALLRHTFIRMGFLPAWREVAGPEGEAKIFDALERRLNEGAATLGELPLTIPMACVEARRPAEGGRT
jgi:ubiquinone/menaquinone biosynthesis C-methylase UbiE